MSRFDFRNKIALVTGASSGIGEKIALELARRGARPILTARRKKELERVSAEIGSFTGYKAPFIAADLTETSGRSAISKFIAKNEGILHILINNAGITAHGRFDTTKPDVLRRTLEINFFSMAELTHAILPLLKKGRGEKMIAFISTPAGLYGLPGRFAYSAGKAAGHALMESLRIELKKEQIYTTIFCPGYVRTNLRKSGLDAGGDVLQEKDARGAAKPEDVARRFCDAIEKKKRIAFYGFNGHAIYWLRTLMPGLLERLIAKKLRNDY